MDGKQDVPLCFKVNKTWQKCHVNCVVGIPEGSVTIRIVWVPGFFIHSENKGAGRRVTRCHTTLGSGLVLVGPGLRIREWSELYRTC